MRLTASLAGGDDGSVAIWNDTSVRSPFGLISTDEGPKTLSCATDACSLATADFTAGELASPSITISAGVTVPPANWSLRMTKAFFDSKLSGRLLTPELPAVFFRGEGGGNKTGEEDGD